MGNNVRGLTVWFVAAWCAAGCAAHRNNGLTGRLIKGGMPKVQITRPQAPPDDSARKRQALPASPLPRLKQSMLLTVESTDPELLAALLAASAMPTAAHHRRVAEQYRRLGINDAAHEHLSRAVLLDPTDAAAFDARARLWRDWGLPEFGLGDAYRATHHAPASATAHNTLGTLLYRLRWHQQARAAFARAVALDAGATFARSNLCRLLQTIDVKDQEEESGHDESMACPEATRTSATLDVRPQRSEERTGIRAPNTGQLKMPTGDSATDAPGVEK